MCIRDRYQRRVRGLESVAIGMLAHAAGVCALGCLLFLLQAPPASSCYYALQIFYYSDWAGGHLNSSGQGTALRCPGSFASARSVIDSTYPCLLYTSPSPRDRTRSRMPSSA
eukprot:TRINITY_DN8023_c0_g1_i2.p2 TRINITY_DN8023_c0_g1~~TRINITY_DN8023_c0_g1_i2.p2  ORF type:complete len:112 (-),score=23.89 TRINITY_DN8023_c0_g1_i2:40-375(-)